MAEPTVPTSELGGRQPIAPFAAKGDNATIWSASGDPGSALDADWQAGTIINTKSCSRLACTVKYDADGSGTNNQFELFFAVSNASSKPAIADDEWAVLAERDVSPAETAQADSFPTNFDATASPEWDLRVLRGFYYQSVACNNTSDKVRLGFVLDVRSWKYIVVLAKEVGDTSNAGTLVINAALSA